MLRRVVRLISLECRHIPHVLPHQNRAFQVVVLGHQFVESSRLLQRDQPDLKAIQYLLLSCVRPPEPASLFSMPVIYNSMGGSLFRFFSLLPHFQHQLRDFNSALKISRLLASRERRIYMLFIGKNPLHCDSLMGF